jgi:hypothetical protein
MDSNLRQSCCWHSCRAARGGKSPEGRPEGSAQVEIPQGSGIHLFQNDRYPNVGRLDEDRLRNHEAEMHFQRQICHDKACPTEVLCFHSTLPGSASL